MLLFWPEKSLASSYKTIAVATKIISHLSNIEKGEGGGGRLCVLGNRSNNYVTDCRSVVKACICYPSCLK